MACKPRPMTSADAGTGRRSLSIGAGVLSLSVAALFGLGLMVPLGAQFPPPLPETGTGVGAGDEFRIDSCSLGPGLNGSNRPHIVGTDNGPGGNDLHVVWQDDRDAESSIYYRRVESYGVGTQPCELRLSTLPTTPQHHAMLPRIATDGVSELYVTYRSFRAVDGNGKLDRKDRIMFVRSVDNGVSWSQPLELSVADHAINPELCTDGQGNVYVVWTQELRPHPFGDVYLAASSDSGASFTAPKRVNNDTSAHHFFASAACDDHGGLSVVYMGQRDPQPIEGPPGLAQRKPYRDVFLQRSRDPSVLFGANPFDDAAQLSHAAEAGRVHIIAYSQGPNAVPDYSLVMVGWKDFDPVVRKGDNLGKLGVESRLEFNYSVNEQPFLDLELRMLAPNEQTTVNEQGPGPAPSPSAHGPKLIPGQPAQSTDGYVLQAPNDGPGFYSLDMAVDGIGRVYASYGRVDSPLHNNDLIPETNSPRYMYARVFDPFLGLWGPEHRISTAGAPFTTQGRPLIPEPHLYVDDADNVFVTWMQSGIEPFGTHETYGEVNAAWSTDGGQTWGGPTGLTNKAAGAGSSGSAHPRVFARGGVAAVVWDDRREWTRHDVPGGVQPGDPLGAPDIYLNLVTLP